VVCILFSLLENWWWWCYCFGVNRGGVDGSDEECGGGADVLSGGGSVSSHNGVATVVVVVDARIWVEVSRFWGFDSSSSEDCWVFRKLAAPLPAVLRFRSFQIGLGFDGGVVAASYPLSRWFCFGRKLELWCGFVLILFVSSFG
jgi:hypothetical protein